MTQYIKKSALVAELEKRRKEAESNCGGYKSYDEHRCDDCTVEKYNEFLEIINTLEVKEVDLEKELDYDDYMNFFKEHPEYDNGDWGFEETWTFGQYCYKLGLKAK